MQAFTQRFTPGEVKLANDLCATLGRIKRQNPPVYYHVTPEQLQAITQLLAAVAMAKAQL